MIAAGLIILLGYVIAGGVTPTGDLPARTTPWIRAVHLALGMAILVLMTAISGWIAFGAGPRQFSSTVSVPFLPVAVSESAGPEYGRVVFGGATVLMAGLCVWSGITGVARLRRERRTTGSGRLLLVALLVLSSGSCASMVRQSGGYKAFVASHNRIRVGMSMRAVFEAGLADYLVATGNKNVPGATVSERQPASPECRRHVVDVHHGTESTGSATAFYLRIFCNMNGIDDRELVRPQVLATKADLLQVLDTHATWIRSMAFRVESPPLQIGGVYDNYTFALDADGRVAHISAIAGG